MTWTEPERVGNNCDFCYVKLAGTIPWTHVLPAPLRVELPHIAPEDGRFTWDTDNDGMWCACEACQRLLEARDVPGLVVRSLVQDPAGRHPVVRHWKKLVFEAFLAVEGRFSFRGDPWSGPLDGQHRRGAS